MNKQFLVFVVFAVATFGVVAVRGQGGELSENADTDAIGNELVGWIREYCLEQRNEQPESTNQQSNEIRDRRRRQFHFPSFRSLRSLNRNLRRRRQAEVKHSPSQASLEEKENYAIYSAILKLEQYVNNACTKVYAEEDSKRPEERPIRQTYQHRPSPPKFKFNPEIHS